MGDLHNPTFYWRPLGRGEYKSIPIQKKGRSVYEVTLKNPSVDFEYYLEAASEDGNAVFPATAPKINAAVIVIEDPHEEME